MTSKVRGHSLSSFHLVLWNRCPWRTERPWKLFSYSEGSMLGGNPSHVEKPVQVPGLSVPAEASL